MTILVDSSVWIDLLGDHDTAQTTALNFFLSQRRRIVVPDLVLVEVLQGTRDPCDFHETLAELSVFDCMTIGGSGMAEAAARYYQALRAKGITVRKTIDTLIATRCILDGLPLLYSDRDFDPFVEHLGLMSALDLPSGVN